MGRFPRERRRLPALALSSNAAVLTMNRFEAVFERRIQAMGKDGDLAWGISTSEDSENVVRGNERENDSIDGVPRRMVRSVISSAEPMGGLRARHRAIAPRRIWLNTVLQLRDVVENKWTWTSPDPGRAQLKGFETPSVVAARAFAYASRFFVAVENLGFASSLKIFALYRLRIKRESVIFARKLNRSIHFRGAADGVLSHFFYPGFRIRDTPEHPVRFIIDAGANVGVETLRFRHFHTEAFIVALEPEEGNHRMLLKNVGQDEKVAVLQAGLWSHQCSLSIVTTEQDNNEAFQVREAANSESGTVSAVSVQSLINRFGCADVDILKMDIEGAEYQVFSQYFESWIDRVKVFIFECPDHEHPGVAFSIFRALEGKPFDCFIQGECLVLIRRDTGWKVESNLFMPSPRLGEIMPPSARALSARNI